MKSTKNEMKHFDVGYNKGFVEGYEQGKLEGAREFAEWLKESHWRIDLSEALNEWQKGEENE